MHSPDTMKILIIDNYDSFTYNVFQYLGELLYQDGHAFRLDVIRNDELTLKEIKRRRYDRIVISPGPGSPDDRAYFGVCADVLTDIGRTTPVLGVCLGMQGMAHYFGGKVVRAALPMHGKTSLVTHDGKGVFRGLPQPVEVMRYHSLVADPNAIPSCLIVTATVLQPVRAHVETGIREVPFTAKKLDATNPHMLKRTQAILPGEIMGLRHRDFPIEGIQFHPESFATEGGTEMIRNFIEQNIL
jgi:anthranilate synthase component 2